MCTPLLSTEGKRGGGGGGGGAGVNLLLNSFLLKITKI